jgi:hypothetical protein
MMHKKTHMPSRRRPQKPPADYKETRQRLQGIRARQQPVTAAQKNEKKEKKMEKRKETSPAWMPSCTFKDFQEFPETVAELFVCLETGEGKGRNKKRGEGRRSQSTRVEPPALNPFPLLTRMTNSSWMIHPPRPPPPSWMKTQFQCAPFVFPQNLEALRSQESST